MNSNMDIRTSIVVNKDQLEEINRIANEEDRTRSQIIRLAIKKYLGDKNADRNK